jgi:hypothetical protein
MTPLPVCILRHAFFLALKAVEKEISDCREGSTSEEWIEICQRLLRANHGLNYFDFLDLAENIAEKRIKVVSTGNSYCVRFDETELGEARLSIPYCPYNSHALLIPV